MKTSTMVWVLVVVIVILGLGWYVWSQGSSSAVVPTSQTQPTAEVVPTGQTQVNTNTTGADYHPNSVASSTPTTASTTRATALVSYDGKTFTPASITVAKGGTVTFTDTSGRMWVAADSHPAHSGYDGSSRAQHCAPGYTGAAPFDQCTGSSSYSFTFTKIGSWPYHDHINDSAGGVVVVT